MNREDYAIHTLRQSTTTKEESVEQEAADNSVIWVYADGSRLDRNVGVAAVLFRTRSDNLDKTLRFKLGSDRDYSVKDAEAVSCVLALWLLKDENQLSISPISIYTDSQSFVQSFKDQRAKTGSYISNFFMKTAAQITKGVCPDILTHRVKLRWIAAHSNVTDNEWADREAHKVAKRRSSPHTSLPKLLKSQLPLNADLVKENFKARLMDNWKANWATSPRKANMDTLDTNFQLDKFRVSLCSLTHPQCSLLFQLRSNHIPLNKYLNLIGKAEDKFCINCKRYTVAYKTVPMFGMLRLIGL